jgi:hypothetical protein
LAEQRRKAEEIAKRNEDLKKATLPWKLTTEALWDEWYALRGKPKGERQAAIQEEVKRREATRFWGPIPIDQIERERGQITKWLLGFDKSEEDIAEIASRKKRRLQKIEQELQRRQLEEENKIRAAEDRRRREERAAQVMKIMYVTKERDLEWNFKRGWREWIEVRLGVTGLAFYPMDEHDPEEGIFAYGGYRRAKWGDRGHAWPESY